MSEGPVQTRPVLRSPSSGPSMSMGDWHAPEENHGRNIPLSKPRIRGEDWYYTYDGSDNHKTFTQRGAINTSRIRAYPPLHSYKLDETGSEGEDDTQDEDEILWHHPRLDLPSPRKILVELFQKVKPRPNTRASQLLMTFGHFIRMDISRTAEFNMGQPMPIQCDMVETRGPFCPAGQEEMEFYRAFRRLNDNEPGSTGEPINYATAWLDMDHIYGNAPPSSPDYLKYRTGKSGMMKFDYTTNLPPIDPETGLYLVFFPNVRMLPTDLALAATFLHYHNKRAEYYQKENPESNDETLFHKARLDTLAVYQYTVETKYIPALLGEPLSDYKGYNNMTDASIDVFFSTSSFRYGHSGISNFVRLLSEQYESLTQDPMVIRDVFDRTEEILQLIAHDTGGNISLAIAAVMRGLTHDATRAPDASFVDDMSLFMAGAVVKNVQRGRDNGLPSYNDAREWFLRRIEEEGSNWKELGYKNLTAQTYLDLAQGDKDVANLLEVLYGEGNVHDVDAYVGAMLEQPVTRHRKLGPLNEMSIREQFERLRDGDRLYYRNRLNESEIQELPTLTDLVQDVWGIDEMKYFPEDTFSIVTGAPQDISKSGGVEGLSQLENGDLMVGWKGYGNNHIDFTMITPNDRVSGGYIGVGWNSRSMKGAEIWFCKSEADDISSQSCFAEDGMTPRENLFPGLTTGPFDCCVADGMRHIRPLCVGHNKYITVLDSCSSDDGSFITVRARVCSKGETVNCFSHEGDDKGNLEMIAAYNPTDVNAAHGFSRRSSGVVNLALGTSSVCTDDSAQAGLFALHGATLLIAWLVLAPIAIFVVRYLKDKPWRLRVHITLVGVIGGLMLTLVTAALVSVEGTSFGTVDAEGATASRHKIFGLSIVAFVVFMIVTGEARRRGALSKKTKSVVLERAVIISHRCGGLLLTGVAWYNCYTGLVQIGPYESDSVEVTFFSSQTVSLGYDLELFGFIRKYLYIPWLCIVIVIFLVAEIRTRLGRQRTSKDMESTVRGVGSILSIDKEDEIPEMTVKTFLFLTKHGSSLSILDGYVIDIHDFMDVHPGGTNVLRFAIGCDITSYFVGELDINGMRHKHSHRALKALIPLVKWKLEGGSNIGGDKGRQSKFAQTRTSLFNKAVTTRCPLLGHVFRNATIVQHEIISPREGADQKCTIRLGISLKSIEGLDLVNVSSLPTSTFVFRAVDSQGSTIERPYSLFTSYHIGRKRTAKNGVLPLLWNPSKSASRDIVYEFFITIVPGGKMSTFLEKIKVGKNLMVKGPMANKPFLEKLSQQPCTDVCLITAGTGITSGLQLADYYLRMPNPPNISLLWLFRDQDGNCDRALKLPDRERATNKFKYLIIHGHESGARNADKSSNKGLVNQNENGTRKYQLPLDRSYAARKLVGNKEREELIKHYHSEGIQNENTVRALLDWATCTIQSSHAPSFNGEDESTMASSRATRHLNLTPGLVTQQVLRRASQDATRCLMDDVNEGLVVALCGRSAFENDMSDALQSVGIPQDQIIHFPEGTVPLSKLQEFVHQRDSLLESESSKSDAGTRQSQKQGPVQYSSPVSPSSKLQEQTTVKTAQASIDSDSHGYRDFLPVISETSGQPFEVIETTGGSGAEAILKLDESELSESDTVSPKDDGEFKYDKFTKDDPLSAINDHDDNSGNNARSKSKNLMESVTDKTNADNEFRRHSTRSMTRSCAHALIYKADGDSAFQAGKYAEAIESYTKAISIDGDNALYFSKRAATRLKRGENLGAIDDANAAIKLDPNLPKGYHVKGDALNALKHYDEAANAFEEGLRKCPDNALLQEALLRQKKMNHPIE